MTIWFSSDPHLGHEMVAHLRGFESAVEHDAALRRNMKKQVRDGDTIYWLGDMAFNGWKERIQWFRWAFPYVEQHVILGNHDRAHPINNRAHAYVGDFLDVFNSASLFARVGYKGKGALLSHFPYASNLLLPVPAGPEWRETQESGYFANQSGEIRGRFGRVLKPWIAGSGYEYVAISRGSEGVKNRTVHSLVCEAFRGPRPTENMQVAHNDGNKLNNRATNLRWATPQENAADRVLHGTDTHPKYSRKGEDNPRAKLSAADALFIRDSKEKVAELSSSFQVSESTIRSIKNGQSWVEPKDKWVNTGDRGEDRYTQYRLRDEGKPLFHGHTHLPNRISLSEKGTPMIHVGLDAWDMKLVSAHDAFSLLP